MRLLSKDTFVFLFFGCWCTLLVHTTLSFQIVNKNNNNNVLSIHQKQFHSSKSLIVQQQLTKSNDDSDDDKSTSTIVNSNNNSNKKKKITSLSWFNNNDWNNTMKQMKRSFQSTMLAASLGLTALAWDGGPIFGNTYSTIANAETDSLEIVKCLFQKCPIELGKCIIDPICLTNVICINTCNGRPDEIDCQIKCGDVLDSPAIGQFNKCVISDQLCVPQKPDEGLYPIPANDIVVPEFNTNLFNGRWYISAGQNPLFDIFPCQVHFFTETSPGKFFGKLNWRVEEPDGEFFTRDAIQEFYQDPKMPSHLINHDNEYLHYKDDWYIIDYEYDNNKDNIPPFAFVYYRGSNDAWDGYGGVVVYTRDAALPKSLLPRLRVAASKIGYNFDTDFTITDNTCPAELSEGEKLILRQQFAGKSILQTEKQLQAAATQFRGNAVNSIKAQKLFFDNRAGEASNAFQTLSDSVQQFESEATVGTTTPSK